MPIHVSIHFMNWFMNPAIISLESILGNNSRTGILPDIELKLGSPVLQ